MDDAEDLADDTSIGAEDWTEDAAPLGAEDFAEDAIPTAEDV